MPTQEISELTKLSYVYGLGIVFPVLTAIGFGALLFYVLHKNDKREERLTTVMDGSIKALATLLSSHDGRVQSAVEAFTRANQFQRDEHKAFQETQDRLIKVLQSLEDGVSRIRLRLPSEAVPLRGE